MTRWGGDPSRRDVLRTAGALGAAGLATSLAGCQQVQNMVGMGSNRTNQVPEDADSALFVDVGAVMDDDGVKTIANAYLDEISQSEYYEGPDDYEELKDRFEDEADLDPSEIQWQIGFSEYSDYGVTSEYGGSLFEANWAEDDVVDALEDNNDVSYDDDDHEGKTVYEPESDYGSYLGVISGSKYVIGSQDAVEDAIDVAAAGGDKMDQELRDAYGSTRNAPVRYVGGMVPNLSETTSVGGEELDVTPLSDVERVAGAVYKDGDKRGTENTMDVEDENDAEDVADVLDGYFALVSEGEYVSDIAKDVADEIEVEQNGSEVVVRYETTVSDVEDAIEESFETPTAY
ncbi:MAG: twin-arginine translocation signal domain-containing protein [Halobacteriales archaeon]